MNTFKTTKIDQLWYTKKSITSFKPRNILLEPGAHSDVYLGWGESVFILEQQGPYPSIMSGCDNFYTLKIMSSKGLIWFGYQNANGIFPYKHFVKNYYRVPVLEIGKHYKLKHSIELSDIGIKEVELGNEIEWFVLKKNEIVEVLDIYGPCYTDKDKSYFCQLKFSTQHGIGYCLFGRFEINKSCFKLIK